MTTPGVSLLPPQIGAALPAPSLPSELSDDEQRLAVGLSTKLSLQSVHMLERIAYYDGTQRLANLGVSVPQQLANVRTVVDWPRVCIDPLIPRAVVDGFRLPGSTDIDSELQEHWQFNDLDAESSLTWLDSLICGRGYMIVGSSERPGGSPLVTVESPLNLAINWDPRTRKPTAAYQAYQAEGVFRAVLYLPDQTIAMSRTQSSGWTVDSRDEHNFGEVPVVRFPNRQRSADREGRSEITPAIMATTDSACRTLLGMEIAREFYSIPHRYILGAQESDFQNADGTAKTALQMSMNKFLAIERDEEGNLPTVGQFAAYDPSVFTKIIDEHAQLMASYTGYPPSYFGQTSTANPASADAIRVAENGLIRRAQQCQNQWSGPLEDVMRLVWRFANGGAEVPAEMWRMETDWEDPATPLLASLTDAMFKQAQMGAVPPSSDIVLKRLGWSAVERDRLAIDRKADAGASVLAELATSLQAKEARVDLTVARDINPQAVKGAPAVNPQTGNVQPPAPTA
ncbi:MAG: phage portal protein [Blastococcus sp.]